VYTVSTLAGSGASGALDGIGTAAMFYRPHAPAIAPDGTLYVADGTSIRSVSADGNVATFVGMLGSTGFVNAQGTAAKLNAPDDMVFASDGTLYFVESSNAMVRAVSTSGVVTTFAGQLDKSTGYDNGIGTAAYFYIPVGICISPDDTMLFVLDMYNNNIRKIIRSTASVTTFAGSVDGSVGGNYDGTGTAALFYYPMAITADVYGNLYVCDGGVNEGYLRKITPSGEVTTLQTVFATSITVTPGGAFIYVGSGSEISRITAGGVATLVAGGETAGSVDGVGTNAQFKNVIGMVYHGGTLYATDMSNHNIRKIVIT
jgi:sugar lactone lactonase YvrE